jgi:GMP synthase-like glutamine amidotransferase
MNEAIFQGYWYRGAKVRWAYYNAFAGEFPTKEDMKAVKGIVFPGSRFSVYDDEADPWIKDLKDFARMVCRDFPDVQMVGICFGH